MGANMGATIGHQRGAGLIEVLVALLIISLGLMSMARLSATTIGFNKGAQVRLVALSLANQYAEHARLNVYLPINHLKEAIALTPGKDVTQPQLLRGVRTWVTGSNDNKQVYDWLYNQMPMGATPLHNAVEKVASYLQVPTGAQENPWAANPSQLASATNPEMSCRRSFNLIFSDGAWSASDSTIKGKDFDNTAGPTFERTGSVPASTFRYAPQGPTDRRLYTPYPSSATGGLADLTAQYYWHKDLRDMLANQVATRADQPAFWQNMTTYTVGYLIKPSGLLVGATSGLTFDQIDAYRTGYAISGYAAATKPAWPTGDTTSLTAAKRVDDFIQAGYTGGGRGFSVQNAEEIRGVFDTILSDILNAAGSDAGIEMASLETGVKTLDGSLKYGVEFRTVDNSGDIKATLLDAMGNGVEKSLDVNGNVLNPASADYWTASKQIPHHTNRRIFSMGSGNIPFEFKGAFSSLPVDVQAALRTGKDKDRIPTDSRFVDYLRGKDPVSDAQFRVFRQRLSPIGAIVNAAPLLMGDEDNLQYNLTGDVSGRNLYAAYRAQIKASSASLFVATNAGAVHAFTADKGKELAAFMPRRSMTKLVDQANINSGFSYALDGPITRNDIFTGTQWNQVAIGTGGRGEKLIYGLRSPLKPNGDRTPDVGDFLWEAGPDTLDSQEVITGHMTNPVRSGQTDSGHWVAIVNSGHYNGQTGGAKSGLVVLNAMTGTLLRSIHLPATFSAGRGLGGVTLERDARRRIVAAYAGDANGNLWRFDLRGAPEVWKVAYGKPLFTTENNRPIYGAPLWQPHPKGGNMVVFATGMVLEDADLADTSVKEGIYGIWDPTSRTGIEKNGFETVQLNMLLTQSIGKPEISIDGKTGYSLSQNMIDWNKHKGWHRILDYAPGERNIDQIKRVGSSVEVNTVTLNSNNSNDIESCTPTNLPKNPTYMLNISDGAGVPAFDVDGDGKIDNVAMVVSEFGGYSRSIRVINHSKSDDGIMDSYGEGDPTSSGNCQSAKFSLIGLINGVINGETSCNDPNVENPKPWSRQQYQLTRPPL